MHHLNGEVASGALVAVIGPNGAGKSTLFRGLAGILKPLAGSIDLGGLDIRDIAYLPQTADIDRSFPISVFDFVGTGLWRTTGFFGGMGRLRADKIAQALAAVGLNGFENRPIGTLSGGQMQRMLFARVLLQDARLIVLDEPFNAIDAKTSADLLALVQALARRGAHRAGGAARHGTGAQPFPGNPAAGARAGGLGRDRGGADRGKSAGGAADVRGVRRQRRRLRVTICRRGPPDC